MMTRVEVTAELAIANLIAGLREIPDGFQQVGCRFADPKVRQSHYTTEINWGRNFADKLASLQINEAVEEVERYSNRLTNLDPQGFHLGKWARVAGMVSRGNKYTVVDGVLCSHA